MSVAAVVDAVGLDAGPRTLFGMPKRSLAGEVELGAQGGAALGQVVDEQVASACPAAGSRPMQVVDVPGGVELEAEDAVVVEA